MQLNLYKALTLKKTYFWLYSVYTYYKENKPFENETPKVRYALEDFQ